MELKLSKKSIMVLGIVIALVLVIVTILIFVLNKNGKVEDEGYIKKDANQLKENFTLMFDEEIPENLEDKIYMAYKLENDTIGKYKINIKLPMLKIKTDVCKKINSEITRTFVEKVIRMIEEENTAYTIYNINFYAVQNDNILTIAIRCTLKEGKNAQRLIIKTYNYDVENDRVLTLSDVVQKYNYNEEKIQTEINSEIEKQIKKTETIKKEGYSVYERIINDPIYKIENVEEFMLDEQHNLYIIYPYGNKNITGEMDLVVITSE